MTTASFIYMYLKKKLNKKIDITKINFLHGLFVIEHSL